MLGFALSGEIACINQVIFCECVLFSSILVMWLECRFLVTEVDGSNPGISMLCLEHNTLSTLLQSTQL